MSVETLLPLKKKQKNYGPVVLRKDEKKYIYKFPYMEMFSLVVHFAYEKD